MALNKKIILLTFFLKTVSCGHVIDNNTENKEECLLQEQNNLDDEEKMIALNGMDLDEYMTELQKSRQYEEEELYDKFYDTKMATEDQKAPFMGNANTPSCASEYSGTEADLDDFTSLDSDTHSARSNHNARYRPTYKKLMTQGEHQVPKFIPKRPRRNKEIHMDDSDTTNEVTVAETSISEDRTITDGGPLNCVGQIVTYDNLPLFSEIQNAKISEGLPPDVPCKIEKPVCISRTHLIGETQCVSCENISGNKDSSLQPKIIPVRLPNESKKNSNLKFEEIPLYPSNESKKNLNLQAKEILKKTSTLPLRNPVYSSNSDVFNDENKEKSTTISHTERKPSTTESSSEDDFSTDNQYSSKNSMVKMNSQLTKLTHCAGNGRKKIKKTNDSLNEILHIRLPKINKINPNHEISDFQQHNPNITEKMINDELHNLQNLYDSEKNSLKNVAGAEKNDKDLKCKPIILPNPAHQQSYKLNGIKSEPLEADDAYRAHQLDKINKHIRSHSAMSQLPSNGIIPNSLTAPSTPECPNPSNNFFLTPNTSVDSIITCFELKKHTSSNTSEASSATPEFNSRTSDEIETNDSLKSEKIVNHVQDETHTPIDENDEHQTVQNFIEIFTKHLEILQHYVSNIAREVSFIQENTESYEGKKQSFLESIDILDEIFKDLYLLEDVFLNECSLQGENLDLFLPLIKNIQGIKKQLQNVLDNFFNICKTILFEETDNNKENYQIYELTKENVAEHQRLCKIKNEKEKLFLPLVENCEDKSLQSKDSSGLMYDFENITSIKNNTDQSPGIECSFKKTGIKFQIPCNFFFQSPNEKNINVGFTKENLEQAISAFILDLNNLKNNNKISNQISVSNISVEVSQDDCHDNIIPSHEIKKFIKTKSKKTDPDDNSNLISSPVKEINNNNKNGNKEKDNSNLISSHVKEINNNKTGNQLSDTLELFLLPRKKINPNKTGNKEKDNSNLISSHVKEINNNKTENKEKKQNFKKLFNTYKKFPPKEYTCMLRPISGTKKKSADNSLITENIKRTDNKIFIVISEPSNNKIVKEEKQTQASYNSETKESSAQTSSREKSKHPEWYIFNLNNEIRSFLGFFAKESSISPNRDYQKPKYTKKCKRKDMVEDLV